MAVAGRQAVAMIDFNHAAIAASPSRRDHLSVRGRPHRVAHGGAEIETGVHGRAAEERIAADPESAGEFDFADHRLAIWHQRKGAVETLDLGAGGVDPVKLALKSAGVGGKSDGNEGAADTRAWRRGFQLRHIEAEIGEHAAHPANARFHALFDRAKGRYLTAFDLIERTLQAGQNAIDALDLRELAGSGIDDNRGTRFQPRLTIRRRHEDHGIVDRRGLWDPRRSRGVGGRSASRWRTDRSGNRGVRNGAKCSGARFQRGLAPHDLIEFLVELLLIEQLTAGGAISRVRTSSRNAK